MITLCFVLKHLKKNFVLGCEHTMFNRLPAKAKIIVKIEGEPLPERETIIPATNISTYPNKEKVYKGYFNPTDFLKQTLVFLGKYEKILKDFNSKIGKNKILNYLDTLDELIFELYYNAGYFNMYFPENELVKIIKEIHKEYLREKENIIKINGGKQEYACNKSYRWKNLQISLS